MESLFRILIIVAFLGIIYYYAGPNAKQHSPLEGPSIVQKPILENKAIIDNEDALTRPTEGLSTYIGKSSKDILSTYGRPTRIDKTPFHYKWWVYHNKDGFKMFGIADDTVVQVYTNSLNMNVAPYEIGQVLGDIYRMTIIDSEVTAQIDDNIYMFAMNDYDLHSRILVKFQDIFAQLYIDTETEKLIGIRYLDKKTLVTHKPYEMQFIGEMIHAPAPSSYHQLYIHQANAAQLADLTNVFREQYGLLTLVNDSMLNDVAMRNSENLFLQSTTTQQTESSDISLKDRLSALDIQFKSASEITATTYIDIVEAMHGWLNSKEHRKVLLDEGFTHIGTGAYMDYYTQILVTKNGRDVSGMQ
ncbi:CAP-associated domain-containing protein [Metasolibacillus meyeri]|uniref:CAP-associated domain-containing protein n=1 Tax=Metasolibacillus meyeri TaxID=1071052 RepID=A0AAW9NPL7_9BACL|nr:CAP-associated domain-containing protein [Metasolibacillus meyeri]MEC1179475.1 CAP-associated domain-containing protein [Metasolibacillus meyeri]